MDSCNVEAIALANEVFETYMPLHIYRGFTILPKTGQTAVVDVSYHPDPHIASSFNNSINVVIQELGLPLKSSPCSSKINKSKRKSR